MRDATIRLLDRDRRMYAGETRPLYAEVTNRSGETWPGGLDEEPRIRLSYHLRSTDGEVLQFDGPRSPIPSPLAPGESQIVPVVVEAPADVGRYVVEIDLVHEHLRWFGQPLAIDLDVVPHGATQRSFGRRRLGRSIKVPRTFHQIWLGGRSIPEEHRRFAEGWRQRHPDWGYRLWTDADLPQLSISAELAERAVTPSELSNLVRYEIVARHGGVYVDTDFECFQSIEPLLRGIDAFAACSFPGNVAPGFFGAVPGHPAIERAATLARRVVGLRYPESTTGPILFTHVLCDFPEVTVFPPELFYPYLWDEPDGRDRHFDGAYAAHHWTLSWQVES